MHFSYIFHVFFMHISYILHAYCMFFACILMHVFGCPVTIYAGVTCFVIEFNVEHAVWMCLPERLEIQWKKTVVLGIV